MDVMGWLLDSDPALRWQVLRDLTVAPAEEVAAERSRVAREGWGAQLLAAQEPDGRWGGGTFFPEWTSTESSLRLLYRFGLDPASDEARRAIAPVHEAARWEYDPGMRFFDGEVEPCINGRAVAIGSYFGQDVRGIVDAGRADDRGDRHPRVEGRPAGLVAARARVSLGAARRPGRGRGAAEPLDHPACAARDAVG